MTLCSMTGRNGALAAIACWLALAAPAMATPFYADFVESYNPGATPAGTLFTPGSALGPPTLVTGAGLGFPNVVNPFSPPFEASEIVSIGEGGQLTLRLSNFVLPQSGPEIGVFTNAGLADATFSFDENAKSAAALVAGDGATTFSIDSAHVEVSADGVNFVSLGTVQFSMPTNAYVDVANPFSGTAGSVVADFRQPYTGGLATLADSTYAEMVTTLGGSGGGTWLDISGSGLSQVGWVRFSVADDLNVGTALNFELDAVSIANGAAGPLVPEPSTWALLAIGGAALGCVVRRRGGRRFHKQG